jgi:RNA polymerase sigma factor (sigma-70 family)
LTAAAGHGNCGAGGGPERMTDEEIIDRVRKGETRQFEQLVRRHKDAVYGMAARFVGRGPDAEDVAQEVFLKAFRSLAGFKGEAKFSTWLYRITFNLSTDWLRRTRRPGRKTAPLDDAREIGDGRVDLEAGLLDAEEKARVNRALDHLDERYRSVVVLLYYQKLAYEEIAAILGVPVKTVETRLYRARKMLREALREDGGGGRR